MISIILSKKKKTFHIPIYRERPKKCNCGDNQKAWM